MSAGMLDLLAEADATAEKSALCSVCGESVDLSSVVTFTIEGDDEEYRSSEAAVRAVIDGFGIENPPVICGKHGRYDIDPLSGGDE